MSLSKNNNQIFIIKNNNNNNHIFKDAKLKAVYITSNKLTTC
jgi:hypothetical protein